jgi:hypothetical protein
MPGEALRVAVVYEYGGHEDSYETNHFPVEGISVAGENGELNLTGERARTTFKSESARLYTLRYE